MDILSSNSLMPERRLAPNLPGVVGALDAKSEMVQAAKNVHVVAQSPPPDARPGTNSPPLGHHAPTNGVINHNYIEEVVRIGLGTVIDGTTGAGMTYPGANISHQTSSLRRIGWKCVSGKWIMAISGGSDA